MPVPYPSNPTVGQTFTYGGVTYTWNGVAWVSVFTRTIGTVGAVAVTSPITNSGTSTAPVIGLADTGVTAGSYTNTNLTVDAKGRITSASNGSSGTTSSYYVSNGTYSLDFSGSASAQSILGGTTTGITVDAGTTYEYEILASLQMSYISAPTMALTHNFTSSVLTLSPTIAYTQTIDYGSNTTGFATGTTMTTIRSSNATGVVVAAAIASGNRFSTYRVRGLIRVTGTGTAKIYPSLTSSTIGDNGVTMQSGVTFKMTPIGNGTVTTVGTWS